MIQIKIITALLFVIFLADGCSNEEKINKEKINEEKSIEKIDSLDEYLSKPDSTKIILLSYIKNVPEDTIELILREYLSKYEYGFFLNTDKSDLKLGDIISSISKKRKISKSKIASIIFSYKYEMITKEDYENNFKMIMKNISKKINLIVLEKISFSILKKIG